MHFAVIQEGHGVFGIGTTEDEALQNSKRLGTPEQIRAALVDQDEADHGDIMIVRCTPELYQHVTLNGFESEIEYTEDGVADIAHSTESLPVEPEPQAGSDWWSESLSLADYLA